MMYEKLALLRSLAAQPSQTVAPCLRPLLEQLAQDGFVTKDQNAGWMATAEGCQLLESYRVSRGARPAGNLRTH